jgi:hypothetical protein
LAVGANAFEDKICRRKGEAWGKNHFWDGHTVKTEGALTLLTEEMHMEVRKGVFVGFAATTVLFA